MCHESQETGVYDPWRQNKQPQPVLKLNLNIHTLVRHEASGKQNTVEALQEKVSQDVENVPNEHAKENKWK